MNVHTPHVVQALVGQRVVCASAANHTIVSTAAGLVYAFDWQYFLTELLAAFLFLKIAGSIMDFITFNLLPNGLSKVRRAARVR